MEGELGILEKFLLEYNANNDILRAFITIRAELAEALKTSHNNARNEIAVDLLRGIMARTLFSAESQSSIVSEFQRQLSSVA